MNNNEGNPSKTFGGENGVLQEELRIIKKKENEQIGLAFSGGGIRSATLCLGVLQGIAKHGLLTKIDYLSTVSGGGYIGAWFSALIHRNGGIENVQKELATSTQPKSINDTPTQTDKAIQWLRSYSNYLTPKVGISKDTFGSFSVWLTNTLLNQIIIVGAIATIAAVFYALNTFFIWLTKSMGCCVIGLGVAGAILCLIAVDLAVVDSTKNKQNNVPDTKITTVKLEPLPSRWRQILCLGYAGVALISVWLINLYPKLTLHDQLSPFWLILPVCVVVISLSIIGIIGLLGREISPCCECKIPVSPFFREWWARLGGISLALCAGWLAAYFLILYAPLTLAAYDIPPFTSAGVWSVIAFAASHLGKSANTGEENPQKIKDILSVILPWLVIAGLIILVSLGVFKFHNYSKIFGYLGIALLTCVITWIFASRVDINIFSLHYFYRNRLARAYLGASNFKRLPSAFTDFDGHDDLNFADCQQKPIHIVNAALNLTKAKNLAWQQRKAASFSFTPDWSGFKLSGSDIDIYRPSSQYAKGVKLGSIMSVSGAAASPNGGYHTAPVTAFLMTLFNARLGRWYGNPTKKAWREVSPSLGFKYLIKELFASTNEDSDFIYLSDGGHFENLGIYELVRRECKVIIAIDAGEDGQYQFEDLGNAIRKCSVDFGVEIDISLEDIYPTEHSECGKFKVSKNHAAIGDIHYADNKRGVLIYAKSSLIKDLPTDLINFKLQEPAFPHHSTIDQFFNESQFESYRHLGEHIVETFAKGLKINKTKPTAQELIAEIQKIYDQAKEDHNE